jgi:hypothetical protein
VNAPIEAGVINLALPPLGIPMMPSSRFKVMFSQYSGKFPLSQDGSLLTCTCTADHYAITWSLSGVAAGACSAALSPAN